MAQTIIKQVPEGLAQYNKEVQDKHKLGPLLCWAVVFADIGTSIYYVPGILYGTVGSLAGLFVFMTMVVFVLLALKYTEVTYRFPQGGGVVTVAAQAFNKWFGALGGMFILVDYFLTAAISCLSGMLYLSVVFPAIGPQHPLLGLTITLWITLGVLVLLGILNWVGISESAKVSLVGAIVAFGSDIAILITVFTHLSFSQFMSLFAGMFHSHTLTPITFLVGFAGAFLAFSGLESISQLSPSMQIPRRSISKIALTLVVITVGVTSPLLTILSTTLLSKQAGDRVLSSQLISLLAGHWGNGILQAEVAISASALLIFASNTAIIGSYHVFLALSRMEFFPAFILKKNRLRGTPHYSIALATVIPIIVLILVRGNINILGDMYAFGLLGAFSLTCLGMDVVRYRQRKARKLRATHSSGDRAAMQEAEHLEEGSGAGAGDAVGGERTPEEANEEKGQKDTDNKPEQEGAWTRSRANFYLGILTTVLVLLAWGTNLIAKPLATAFGGGVALIGMSIAYINHRRHQKQGRSPVVTAGKATHLPEATLAVLSTGDVENMEVVKAALQEGRDVPIVFLYLGEQSSDETPELFEVAAPHLKDPEARKLFGRANKLAQEEGVNCRFVYRQKSTRAVELIREKVQPNKIIFSLHQEELQQNFLQTGTQYEQKQNGTITYLQKVRQ
jgi:amino acid transporter